MTSCFIGLVSHPATAYPQSQGPDGLTACLNQGLAERGIHAQFNIRLENAFDPSSVDIDADLVRRSIRTQYEVERDWIRYRKGPARAADTDLVLQLRMLRMRLSYLGASRSHVTEAGVRMMTRLMNIELSHMALLQQGIESSAEWILILEDDASTRDLSDVVDGLTNLMQERSKHENPLFVNISQSFTPEQLGITHLLDLAPRARWKGTSQRVVWSMTKPVTNTVCAVLYRTSFAEKLLTTLHSIPMTPVVPIDWKLNRALMDMYAQGSIGADACWLVEPAPITQLSLHGGQT